MVHIRGVLLGVIGEKAVVASLLGDPARIILLDFPFPQIATADLDIPILGQFAATHLSFGVEFKPGPIKVIAFEAACGCGGLRKQHLENAPGNPNDGVIFANPDAKLDDCALRIPVGVRRKTKEHEPPYDVLLMFRPYIVPARRNVEPFRA